MNAMAKFYNHVFFWIDNLILIVGFFLYMLIIQDPLILVKIFIQIATKIDGFFSRLYYLTTWSLFGLIFLLYVNLYDTCMFINILFMENSVILD